jgi:uncharacterized radical SAM protein YgiQ
LPFLPVTKEEMKALGWDRPDFVFVTGDAYVDHPSFGHAIISRVLERQGFRVAMLPLPDWRTKADFQRFGRPRLGFLVSAGNIDSMVNHYTANKKKRSQDSYAPNGKAGLRPDRATIVYCNRIRETYANMPIILGGVEASLRRFAHYDYWDNAVRRSILTDSGANLLVYGMGELAIAEIAKFMDRGVPVENLRALDGTCCIVNEPAEAGVGQELPTFDDVAQGKRKYAEAFRTQYDNQDAVRGKRLIQKQDKYYLVQNPPSRPLTQSEMDEIYELPYMRTWHPMYARQGGVSAIAEVEFSLVSSRGCFGGCSFCALHFQQGRVIQARSHESILREAEMLTKLPGFKGYIHDVGGPTANFRTTACESQLKRGACSHRQCLFPQPCEQLQPDHSDYIALLRKLRALPGVKKVFIRSGLRYDYLLQDPKGSAFLKELCEHHISGQLKVAPEHVSQKVLKAMGKPSFDVYRQFVQRYENMNERIGLEQYLVPYFISSHPGSDLDAAIELAEAMRDMKIHPEQVQDFYPTPGTVSTCMYFTGIDPRTMQPVHVPMGEERKMQRALLQYTRRENHALVRKALMQANREDLIGGGPKCLVPVEGAGYPSGNGAKKSAAPAKPEPGQKAAKAPGKSAPRVPKKTAEARAVKPPARLPDTKKFAKVGVVRKPKRK